MDEVSRKEYLRKNRRRPVDQIVNELGEGRGMDRQRTREQLLADAEGNADISQESPRPATRSAERSASRRTTASMCRSRLLRRYVSYTQPPIPIFYCSKNSVSRISYLGDPKMYFEGATLCYTKRTGPEDLIRAQLGHTAGQEPKHDECSSHEYVEQPGGRRQTLAESTIPLFEDFWKSFVCFWHVPNCPDSNFLCAYRGSSLG